MTNNKPPMTVWVRPVKPTTDDTPAKWSSVEQATLAYTQRKARCISYISKDWLKEELLKRSKEGMGWHDSPEKYLTELGRAVKDIFRDLNGGKNEL